MEQINLDPFPGVSGHNGRNAHRRLGELLALEWGDIDFRGGFIEVRLAHVLGHFTTPKNGKTRRVDMSRQLAETLKLLLTEPKKDVMARGWGKSQKSCLSMSWGR